MLELELVCKMVAKHRVPEVETIHWWDRPTPIPPLGWVIILYSLLTYRVLKP